MIPLIKVVVAPHADDEVLGAGGSISRWAREGHRVHVVVATRGLPPLFSAVEEETCRAETLLAHARMGVASSRFLDLPAAGLDRLKHRELNRRLADVLEALAPDELYLPFLGDVHRDHQEVFRSAMVAARPCMAVHPRRIYAYETLSETNWNAPFLTPAFTPNHFVDIADTLEDKLDAFALFRSQVKPPPHERSLEALRGATAGLRAAEAFVTVRTIS
jgi:LmbE family N-acetylglucosaminyl deacetylase